MDAKRVELRVREKGCKDDRRLKQGGRANLREEGLILSGPLDGQALLSYNGQTFGL